MVLFLEVTNGPLTGEKHRIRKDFAIGRREGDLILDDGKVSGLHAKIDVDNKGQPLLVDQGSANGLVLDRRKVRKIALLPGLIFKVGDTEFKVIELTEDQAEDLSPTLRWQDKVEKHLQAQHGKNRPLGDAGVPFSPAVRLEFTQGLQADEAVVLGYGPRIAGHEHLDIELKDPAAPDVAFELRPSGNFALFRDLSDGSVKLNGASPSQEQPVREGDLISFGTTIIKVRFL